LVTLGDYVDRGPDGRKIIERLMAGLGRVGWRLICLKGNHEDIMWQTCRRLPDVDWWLTNGGGATLISYGQHKGDQADVVVVPAAHLDWIEQLFDDGRPGGPIEVLEVNGEPIVKILSSRRSTDMPITLSDVRFWG
jgi:hypothetical protein